MDSDILLDYIKRVIKPYKGTNKFMLLLDDQKANKTEQVINYFNENQVEPLLILGSLTYCLYSHLM